jgi:hypothetical protein
MFESRAVYQILVLLTRNYIQPVVQMSFSQFIRRWHYYLFSDCKCDSGKKVWVIELERLSGRIISSNLMLIELTVTLYCC